VSGPKAALFSQGNLLFYFSCVVYTGKESFIYKE
jgi:hypothetical protein